MERITSRQNPLFQRLKKLNTSPAFRRQAGVFSAEGPKLLAEALRWGADIETVIAAQGADLPQGAPDARWVETPADVLTSLADTESPQGIIFLCRMPDTALPDRLPPGRYLVLDGIQDPGNLGTIWRTADALGCAGLLLTGPCADPFGPKAVRATMGACFRLPVWRGERGAVAALIKGSGIPLWAAALREDTADIRSVNLGEAAVVIGSEGRGVSAELLSLCDGALRVPMTGRCESLNAAVAASIVLWEGWRAWQT